MQSLPRLCRRLSTVSLRLFMISLRRTLRSSILAGCVAVFLGILLLSTSSASAQTEGTGLGGMIGVSNGSANPVGLSAKGWVSERQAVQAAASFVIADEEAGASYLILQGDYLFHNFEQVSVGDGLLALYVGPGLQLAFIEDQDTDVAFRAPLGVSYMLADAPIDIFAEVAPTLQVAQGSQLRFDGAFGFRYFL